MAGRRLGALGEVVPPPPFHCTPPQMGDRHLAMPPPPPLGRPSHATGGGRVPVFPRSRAQLFKLDVEMQGFCQTYAAEFNKRGPPKPVVFLEAFLICRTKCRGQPVYACEAMVMGEWEKHNNNLGDVCPCR